MSVVDKNTDDKKNVIFRSAQVYNFIDSLLEKNEYFYRHSYKNNFLTEDWYNRLAQRLAEYLTPHIVSLIAHRSSLGKNPIPSDLRLNLLGISLFQNNGEIRISRWLFIKSIVEFSAHWFKFAIALLSIGRRHNVGLSSKILLGIGDESLFLDGTDAQFIQFCEKGNVPILHKWKTLLVQGDSDKKSTAPGVIYCKQPIHTLLASIQLGYWGRFYCLVIHLLAWPKFFLDACRLPSVVLLARDYAQFNVMQFLGEAGAIEALIYTNSNYLVQPLWARLKKRPYRTHLIWYSQNCFPFIYKDDSTVSYLPGYKQMAIDQHWVWTAGFQQYLSTAAKQNGNIEVIGPVMWYLPKQVDRRQANTIKIAIFDVTPFKNEIIKKVGLYDNYYSSATARKFIKDIVNVFDDISQKNKDLKIELFLKHKRGQVVGHDVEYLQLVEDLHTEGRIKLAPSNSNIYSLLYESDLSIAIPYTSTVYISSSINKPAIYFDPTDTLFPSYEKSVFIRFAGSVKELKDSIMQVIF